MTNPEYIDQYFKKELSPEEVKQFDQKIISDPGFAEEVAFYYNTMLVLKDQSTLEKKQRFRDLYNKNDGSGKVIKMQAGRWRTYIAAAAIVAALVLGVFIFTGKDNVSQLADNYIHQHFSMLSVSMGTKEDELQKGLRLYNENKLPEALQQFEKIILSDTTDFLAKKNAGIVSLRLQQYDKALSYFSQVASQPGLYSNPGIFYEAVTLLKRNRPGDAEQAHRFLKEVVQKDLEGSEDAAQWLKNF